MFVCVCVCVTREHTHYPPWNYSYTHVCTHITYSLPHSHIAHASDPLTSDQYRPLQQPPTALHTYTHAHAHAHTHTFSPSHHTRTHTHTHTQTHMHTHTLTLTPQIKAVILHADSDDSSAAYQDQSSSDYATQSEDGDGSGSDKYATQSDRSSGGSGDSANSGRSRSETGDSSKGQAAGSHRSDPGARRTVALNADGDAHPIGRHSGGRREGRGGAEERQWENEQSGISGDDSHTQSADDASFAHTSDSHSQASACTGSSAPARAPRLGERDASRRSSRRRRTHVPDSTVLSLHATSSAAAAAVASVDGSPPTRAHSTHSAGGGGREGDLQGGAVVGSPTDVPTFQDPSWAAPSPEAHQQRHPSWMGHARVPSRGSPFQLEVEEVCVGFTCGRRSLYVCGGGGGGGCLWVGVCVCVCQT